LTLLLLTTKPSPLALAMMDFAIKTKMYSFDSESQRRTDHGMSTSLQAKTIGSASLWWLRFVRTIALCSLLTISVPWYAVILRDLKWQDRLDLLSPILFCPLWLPFAWVFWGLCSNVSAHTVKKALAVALGCGSLILVLFSFLLAITSFDADGQMFIVYALVVLLQVAILLGTMKAYYSMDREPGDLRILATRLAFDSQLFHEVHKPLHRSRGFDAHTHRVWKLGIKLSHVFAFVLQSHAHYFPRFGVQHGHCLLASVQITSYNSHLGLLRSEHCRVNTEQFTRAVARPASLWHQPPRFILALDFTG
jgi:hypothetical protein